MRLRPEVRQFQCGTEAWEIVIADYLKAPIDEFGAAKHVSQNGYRAFLYYEDSGEIVGFGSIGTVQWDISGRKEKVSLLQAFAISTPFHGKPTGLPREERYSFQILSDLAKREHDRGRKFLGLHVDKQNPHAIRLYNDFGFVLIEESNTYNVMVLMLE